MDSYVASVVVAGAIGGLVVVVVIALVFSQALSLLWSGLAEVPMANRVPSGFAGRLELQRMRNGHRQERPK